MNQESSAPAGGVPGVGLGVLVVLLAGGCGRSFDAPPAPEVTVLKGRVVTDEQPARPLAGVRVRLLECGLSVLSGPDGRFSLDDVPNGDYTVRVDAQLQQSGEPLALALQRSEQLRGAVRDLPDLVLQATGQLTGTLSIADGSSPLGAVVYAVGGDRLAAVGADGGFRLAGLPAGDWTIGAVRPGYQLQLAEPRAVVHLAPGQQQTLTLTLEPLPADGLAGLSGAVWLSNPGPEVGVEVLLRERFFSLTYRAYTDDNGQFAFAGLQPGLYELLARHPGYRPVGLPNLELLAGEDLALDRVVVLPRDDRSDPTYPWDGDPSGDLDDDDDSVADSLDNCPIVPNPGQVDSDADGLGDACDPDGNPSDPDGDGVPEAQDNCPGVANADQANSDDDPLGDACDPDDDEDGILDAVDPCPLLPDPAGDPALCNWPGYLIYAAQDEDGSIRLRRVTASAAGFGEQRYATGAGEAWGATVSDNGWIFYHHRPAAAEPFRLCALPLADPEASPICFRDWTWAGGGTGDAMNPTVCFDGLSQTRYLFYEHQTDQGWRLYQTVVPDAIGDLQPGALLDLESGQLHNPPPRLHNYRDPSCWVTADGAPLLAYAVDFREQLSVVDGTLDWNSYYLSLADGVPAGRTSIAVLPTEHERHPAPDGIGGWIVERGAGLRIDLVRTAGQTPVDLVADGSRNQAPAMLPLALGGLLAYQSDAGGSFDLYLMSLGSGSAVRLSQTDGWAGSPTWSP